jgi:hypothetical protein
MLAWKVPFKTPATHSLGGAKTVREGGGLVPVGTVDSQSARLK